MKTIRPSIGLCLLALGGTALTSPAHAQQMVLTSTAIAAGFSLSTFATGFPNSSSIGPLGMAFDGNKVIVGDNLGNVRVFQTDTDGQSAVRLL